MGRDFGDHRVFNTPIQEAFIVGSTVGMSAAGLKPIVLAAKEGLALINGTQVSTAFALVGLFEASRTARNALVSSSLSTDAIMGSTAPFEAEIHALRGHRGQIEVAAATVQGAKIIAPVAADQPLGEFKASLGGQPIASVPLVALQAVPEAGFFGRLWDAFLMLFVK